MADGDHILGQLRVEASDEPEDVIQGVADRQRDGQRRGAIELDALAPGQPERLHRLRRVADDLVIAGRITERELQRDDAIDVLSNRDVVRSHGKTSFVLPSPDMATLGKETRK